MHACNRQKQVPLLQPARQSFGTSIEATPALNPNAEDLHLLVRLPRQLFLKQASTRPDSRLTPRLVDKDNVGIKSALICPARAGLPHGKEGQRGGGINEGIAKKNTESETEAWLNDRQRHKKREDRNKTENK